MELKYVYSCETAGVAEVVERAQRWAKHRMGTKSPADQGGPSSLRSGRQYLLSPPSALLALVSFPSALEGL